MRRGVLVTVLATAVAAVTMLWSVSVAAGRTLISVRPDTGHARTVFVIRFRHPDRTGRVGGLMRTDELTLAGTGAGTRCISRASVVLRAAGQGRIATVKLRPGRLGGRWCAGRFHGRIVESSRIVCPTQRLCPLPAIIWRTISRFSFRVGGSGGPTGGGGSPTQGPTFAGLVSATTCIVPMPHPLPDRHSFNLTWNRATDPDTPSSAIVYDIYYSPSSGGEDFADPTWTSAPGATSYTAQVDAGPAYFVVRARDRAGREDHNTVQRPGLSICG
jgi:hypothetical protein